MKIGETRGEMNDFVLLTYSPEGVHLERRGNATLEVIAAIASRDIAAVVEIKAVGSPSDEQRPCFKRRPETGAGLRSVPTRQPLEVHFVPVDKALSVGEHSLAYGKPPVKRWERGSSGGTWIG